MVECSNFKIHLGGLQNLQPGKSLAFMSSETPDSNTDVKMQNGLGEWVISPEQKLKIFEYYRQLYASDKP